MKAQPDTVPGSTVQTDHRLPLIAAVCSILISLSTSFEKPCLLLFYFLERGFETC